jgi:hypothetical protein
MGILVYGILKNLVRVRLVSIRIKHLMLIMGKVMERLIMYKVQLETQVRDLRLELLHFQATVQQGILLLSVLTLATKLEQYRQ